MRPFQDPDTVPACYCACCETLGRARSWRGCVTCRGACSLSGRQWGTVGDSFRGRAWSDQCLWRSSGARVEWASAWRRWGEEKPARWLLQSAKPKKLWAPHKGMAVRKAENTGPDLGSNSVTVNLCQNPTGIIFSTVCIPLHKMRTLDWMVSKSDSDILYSLGS